MWTILWISLNNHYLILFIIFICNIGFIFVAKLSYQSTIQFSQHPFLSFLSVYVCAWLYVCYVIVVIVVVGGGGVVVLVVVVISVPPVHKPLSFIQYFCHSSLSLSTHILHSPLSLSDSYWFFFFTHFVDSP